MLIAEKRIPKIITSEDMDIIKTTKELIGSPIRKGLYYVVPILPSDVEYGKDKFTRHGVYSNSRMKGARTTGAFIVESAVLRFLNGKAPHEDDWGCDMLLNDFRYDIKNKVRKVYPNAIYNANVFQECKQAKYNCDKYLFCSLMADLSYVCIMGEMSKEHFWKLAILVTSGDYDFTCKDEKGRMFDMNNDAIIPYALIDDPPHI